MMKARDERRSRDEEARAPKAEVEAEEASAEVAAE